MNKFNAILFLFIEFYFFPSKQINCKWTTVPSPNMKIAWNKRIPMKQCFTSFDSFIRYLVSCNDLWTVWNGAIYLCTTSSRASFKMVEKNRLTAECAFLKNQNKSFIRIQFENLFDFIYLSA